MKWFHLSIHWRLSTILETSNKSVVSNIFWYVKISIFWKYIQCTIHWDKTQSLEKLPWDKLNGTKNALVFLSRAQTHYSFTFNLRLLYKVKHKVLLSKTMCRIFHFRFCIIFVKVYIFVQQNVWTVWLKIVIASFKIGIIEKTHTILLPDVWFLSCNKQEILKFNDICVSWSSPNLTWWQIF